MWSKSIKADILTPGFIEDYFRKVIEAGEQELRNHQKKMSQLEGQLTAIDGRIEELVDVLADRRLPRETVIQKIEAEQERKDQVGAEIRRKTPPILTLPSDLDTFRKELVQAINDPESRKAAFHGLIRQITIHPDAALELEYVIQTGAQENSATGNRTPV